MTPLPLTDRTHFLASYTYSVIFSCTQMHGEETSSKERTLYGRCKRVTQLERCVHVILHQCEENDCIVESCIVFT